MDAEASRSLLPFALLILACLAWIILVGILLPRLLGRSLAFLANRFLSDTSHISIPSLYIYPLSGRVVAHSVRYTIPNGTISVEELVLQCRWWRKVHEVQFRQLLNVDDPHTLDPVAAEQQTMERENAAFFIRRIWYRLRRWWHATAVSSDPNNSVEPRPLISLICVGLGARIVNDEKNYAHINKVLTLARATARRSAQFDGPVPSELEIPLENDFDASHPSALSAEIQPSSSPSSSSTYSSVESVDSKPWQQRVLEFVSLRISDGAFYFCDMGTSPLVRLSVNSAKLRYRYGAAACSVDECRKRIRMRVSGLKLSVSSQKAVEAIVRMPTQSPSDSQQSGHKPNEGEDESNTDKMIRRIMLLGHEGLSVQKSPVDSRNPWTTTSENGTRRRLHSVLPRLSSMYTGKHKLRMARIPQVVPYSEVLNATTAVIDYVFDEPGCEPLSKETNPQASSRDICHEGSSDTNEKLPAPVCKVSILLRGSSFSYDFQAIADIERVVERLQPVFYDLRSLARGVRSGEAKRSADGIQIEVEATPKTPEDGNGDSGVTATPLIRLPFIPQQSTWRGLLAMNFRRGPDGSEKQRNQEEDDKVLPQSQLSILASRITFRTEVPYHVGVAQKSVLSIKDVAVNAEGVVDMPIGSSKTLAVTRVIHYPVCWNEEHVVTTDLQASEAEFLYLPDTLRVIHDINGTIQTLIRKPESVRYFVPFRETTRIFAVHGYRVILSCSHDNAWHDIHAGEADQYGRLMICGQDGELLLSPNVATEFVQDSTVFSWSLSLPHAVGKLYFSFPEDLSTINSQEKVTSSIQLEEAVRSGHQKSRASSLANFVKSWETFGGHNHHPRVPMKRRLARHFGIELLRAGRTCKVSGKVVVHERHVFLGTSAHAFLDSVNRSDIHFKTSSLQFDLNPHHVTQIFSFLRNYAGPGLHTIDTNEGTQLTKQRLSTARRVLMEGRFPTAAECLVIGLPAGNTLSSQDDRTALDDVLCVTFQIDQLLVRLHDQAHALSAFYEDTRDACSLECRKFYGSLASNRLGLELSCSPDRSKNVVFLREGYREFQEDFVDRTQIQHVERMIPPTASIHNLQITKRSWADSEWGSYHSELNIDIASVTGCIRDTSVARLAHFASKVVPDALHEDSLAVAAMLSIENIEVQVTKVDLLVLSASSALSADRSGQMNKLAPSERLEKKRLSPSNEVPKFLSGVCQVQLPVGLRFVMSNLASEDIATKSRVLIPDIVVYFLMPWGGKLIPWVDDMTIRAQVTHATMLGHSDVADGFLEVGLLRRVAEARGITVDLNYDTRPLLWSTRVMRQQKVHIARLRSQIYQDSFPWCNRDEMEPKEGMKASFGRDALRKSWWSFLDGACKASSIEESVERQSRTPHHLDYLSVCIVTKAVIAITPESLELANDVIIRSKEVFSSYSGRIDSASTGSVDGNNTSFSVSDVMQLWREFEDTRKAPMQTANTVKPATSMKVVETKGLTFILTSPVIFGGGRDREAILPLRRDADILKLTAPFGINFLHLTKADTPNTHEVENRQSKDIQGPSTMTFISVNHASLPSLNVRCNGQELIELSGMVLISRLTMKASSTDEAFSEGEVLAQHVRKSRVGRVASLRIGSKNSALHVYACLGRVLSIFVLLYRALRLEATVLFNLRMKRIEELCALLFSSSINELRSGNPQAIRNFFVQAAHYLQSTEEERAAAIQRGTLISDQFRIPSNVLRNLVTTESSCHYVDSIDVSIRDFSLKAANHAVVDGDFFQCKGGFRNDFAEVGPHLKGHVLNASLGTILLSIRDDTAADALTMVSEVASFLRTATFSLPTIRHDVRGTEQRHGETPEMSSISDKNEKLLRAKEKQILKSGLSRFTRTRKGLWGSSFRSANRRRERHPIYRRDYRRSGSSLKRSGGRTSDEINHSNQGMPYPWHRNLMMRPPRDLDERLNVTQVLERDHSNHTNNPTIVKQSPLQRKKGMPQSRTGSLGPSFDNEIDQDAKGNNWNRRAPLRVHGPNGSGSVSKDERSAYIAVRTAGESGPPQKRAKFMVQQNSVVPPAFSDVSARVAPSLRIREFGASREDAASPESFRGRQRISQQSHQELVPVDMDSASNVSKVATSDPEGTSSVHKEAKKGALSSVTLFVSCRKIACHYFRGKSLQKSGLVPSDQEADIHFLISEPRLTYVSSPQIGNHSVVVTSSSAELQSANDPNCVLTGSIGKIGLTMSIAQGYAPSPSLKLIMSAQLSEFTTTLHATDLQSVLTFRERFKKDVKGVLSAFVRTKKSISEVARATRLSSARMLYPSRTVYSTLAFDLLCENSNVTLEGFHPKDDRMTVAYNLEGMFFSVVASEDENAALTLGLRLYGHGLSLAAPSWESTERLRFPSLDAKGVQWGETTGLPTILKVTAEPLMNSTSVQGLRHVLFTVAGLMAFQNVSPDMTQPDPAPLAPSFLPRPATATSDEGNLSGVQASGAPFSRSFAAWERTKGVRMDISIRPMSLSLVSGQVLALFDVDTITGIFEWNKLVKAGVQLHMAVSIPRISLSFMRMPSSEFTIADIRPSDKRTSLSIALERSRVDLLKTQEELTHTFTFRIDIFAVSGQIRPWKLLLDAASWADEQEFVADLQAINYNSLSSGRQRQPRTGAQAEFIDPVQHRVILIGANVQRFILAVPLLSTEEHSSSRLALRATELHCLARQRLHGAFPSVKNVMELRTHFIGILWENSPLLSTHHARIAFSIRRPSMGSTAHFGETSVVMYPGTWRICPRKDVVLAIIEAKNRKENRKASERTRELLAALPEMPSYPPSSVGGDSLSYATEKQSRLLFESLTLKTGRTSGFIEGLGTSSQLGSDPHGRGSLVRDEAPQVAKLSVPSFSVAVVRLCDQGFDIVDIDFSGREGGEFPRGCLGKVSNIFTDLFGAVTADQVNEQRVNEPVMQIQHSREITRDVSVLIRFGRSLYRAQEEVNSSTEAKFGFFAGKSSSLLISLYTSTALEADESHSTVITGISPRLGLEITPVLSGAKMQSLRLTDARFLHGISPSSPPHTLMHISRVTALTEAKTLLLIRSRLGWLASVKSAGLDPDGVHRLSSSIDDSERKVMFLLGKTRSRRSSFDSSISEGKEHRVEPDIRLQLKFPGSDDSPGDEVDLFVERCIFGVTNDRMNHIRHAHRFNAYAGFHNVILRAQWDLLGCKLQLREALLCFDVSDIPWSQGGLVSMASIVNRLQFESMQYGRNTAKVDIDAVAALWAIPTNEVLVESTSVYAEVAYTLQNAKTKLSGQVTKLRNEVKLLTEKDRSRDPRRTVRSYESLTFDSVLNGQEGLRELNRPPGDMRKRDGPKSSESGGVLETASGKHVEPRSRSVLIKGDDLVVKMRGYQFDEAQQSAEVALSSYDLRYLCDSAGGKEGSFHRGLDIDFSETRLSYVDEDRGINSDLFRIPSPKLNLSIVEDKDTATVDLRGKILIALKHGFYYLQDFRNVAELTIMGIEHAPSSEAGESTKKSESGEGDGKQVWNGKEAKVRVRLNPKIDVIGDLTEDMLHMKMIKSRLGKAEAIPRQMYDLIIVPLEAFSDALLDPLYR